MDSIKFRLSQSLQLRNKIKYQQAKRAMILSKSPSTHSPGLFEFFQVNMSFDEKLSLLLNAAKSLSIEIYSAEYMYCSQINFHNSFHVFRLHGE